MQEKTMKRGQSKLVAGVCSGMAEYFDMSPVWMRIIWVGVALMTRALPVMLIYLILAFALPDSQGRGGFIRGNQLIMVAAIALIAVGGYIVMRQLLPWLTNGMVFAVVCIAAGVALIVYYFRKKS